MRAVVALVTLAGTLLVATFLVYVVTLIVPGDPAIVLFHARYGDLATPRPDLVEAIRHEAGFDQPVVVQYAHWLGHVLRGDLGVSLSHQTPILPALASGLPITLGLVFGALVLALVLSLGIGVLATQRQWVCSATLAMTQFGLSLPDYFFALVLMLFFAVQLRVLPVSGWGTPAGLVLPVATLMLRPWATFTRLVVTGVDEARGADFVRTGRAKGLGDRYLLFRHVLPHALLPVISLVGISASGALATALIVEVIFAIPGVGRLLYQGVLDRDIPLVQACLLVQVSLAVSANMIGNVAMGWANPALRR